MKTTDNTILITGIGRGLAVRENQRVIAVRNSTSLPVLAAP
jgi:short-subunit dehydrogenase involved in D-alanine esterification of teichoic acids